MAMPGALVATGRQLAPVNNPELSPSCAFKAEAAGLLPAFLLCPLGFFQSFSFCCILRATGCSPAFRLSRPPSLQMFNLVGCFHAAPA